jgi:copper(I)-binding protein
MTALALLHDHPPMSGSSLTRIAAALAAAALAGAAAAHDYRVGAIVIDHPYATPSADGAAAVHFRALRNAGSEADRLLGARTPVASAVELQHFTADAPGAKPQPVGDLPLPPGREAKTRHDGEWRLWLTGLKAPLKPGDSFQLTLHFEKAGDKDVSIDVVQPRAHRH